MQELAERIRKTGKEANLIIQGKIENGHANILLPSTEQKYWTPQLSLSMEEFEGQTIVRGSYSPRPTVWTMFVFFYSVIGLAALVISVIGYSMMSLGKSGAILLWVPILFVIFLSLFLTARIGQNLAKDQLHRLHEFVEKLIGE